MNYKTKKKLVNDFAAFVKTYHGFKLHPAQTQMMKAIMSGKRIVVTRPRPYGRSNFYKELAKAFKSGNDVIKRTPITVYGNPFLPNGWYEVKRKEWGIRSPAFDEYITGNWPAECFGVDYAIGKDKSVTVFVPKEEK